MNNNITSVSDSYLCSGCGACKAICTKEAISFTYSNMGRLIPIVNKDCVDCGKCKKVCPSIDFYNLHNQYGDRFVGEISSVKVGHSSNFLFYKNAQSGGICASILSFLFAYKKIDCALVCNMDFGKEPYVRAKFITKKEDIYASQKSCYTPVELLSLLKYSHEYKSIAVVGLPCHIQGIVSLMKTSNLYSNISYKIGLVCDRTLCNSIQKIILSYCNFDQCKIDWRRKSFTKSGVYYPYSSAPVVVYDKSGEETVLPNSYRFSLKDLLTPPRCRVCYDKLNTHSDIVLGDPWSMNNVNMKEGDSLIITRTEKGNEIIDTMIDGNYINVSNREVEEAVIGQHIPERKKSVSEYSKALEIIPSKCDSYLYDMYDGSISDLTSTEIAKTTLLQYINNEQLAEKDIIDLGRNTISKTNKILKRENSFFYKLYKKINKIIH